MAHDVQSTIRLLVELVFLSFIMIWILIMMPANTFNLTWLP